MSLPSSFILMYQRLTGMRALFVWSFPLSNSPTNPSCEAHLMLDIGLRTVDVSSGYNYCGRVNSTSRASHPVDRRGILHAQAAKRIRQ